MKLTRRKVFAVAVASLLAQHGLAFAQAYPQKQITLVVAYPAGGDTDAIARVYAEKLAARLGQPVVVDNRPGASGTVGNASVARAPADGYTLLFTPSTFPIAPHVLKKGVGAEHDVIKDFTPVILTGRIPLMLVAHPGAGLRDVKTLVDAARGGRKLSYASPGSGSPMHIVAEMFNNAANVKIIHVPYKGVAPAVNDVLGGHVELAWITPGAVAQHLATGKLTLVAVAERQRSPLLPNVPTLIESGYKDLEVSAWFGVLGPKGLSADIVRTLNTAFNEVLKMPDVTARMATLGAYPVGGESAVLTRQIEADDTRFGRIVKELNIQAD